MPVTKEEIYWAYDLFLNRKPENQTAIQSHLSCNNIEELCKKFINSDEYINKQNNKFLFDYSNLPRMDICLPENEEQENTILSLTSEVWQNLGKEKPYWSVITSEEYTENNIKNNIENFYNSGEYAYTILKNSLARNGYSIDAFKSIAEIGCGVGRVTKQFVQHFEKVHACDISSKHIEIAKKICDNSICDITWHTIKHLKDYNNIPKCDLVYSIIVLQHNPPNVIKAMLEYMFEAINPGGFAFFQVPTYANGYSFSFNKYIKKAGKVMEMHVLPQRYIFKCAYEKSCIPIEVYNDNMVGNFGISNTFLIRKI